MLERCHWAKAWLEHYQRLLNVEFDWDPDHLSYQPPVEGPTIPITIDMVKKAVAQMKAGKAPGPSGIVVEMIQAAGDMGASMIRDLAAAIIRDGMVPSDWEQSFIVCLYKGKGDALERGNYCSLKLTEQVMKVQERIVYGLIRQMVSIDDSQFGFVQGRGTTDAVFVVRQLQEKYPAANKRPYMAFVDLEKAFDRVPRKVIWLALRKLGVEWIVRLVQGMYANARSHVCVGEGYSEEFEVKDGVHQSSVLSPLLFIIVPEALSREFCSGVPWEDLFADDLVIITESLEECVRRLLTWQEAMEKKGLRVNAEKDKNHDLWYGPGPPAEFRRVSMHCLSHWSGQQQHLLQRLQALGAQEMQLAEALDKGPRLQMCQGTACPLDGRPQKEVQVGPDKLEVVASFCYLGECSQQQVAVNFQPQHVWTPPGRSSRICYQFSLHATSLSRHVAECTTLVCREQCSTPVRLGHWQSQPSSVCSEMTGQWSDRSAVSGRKTFSPPGPVNYLPSLALRIWTSFWRREGSAGMDMWNAPVVQ